MPHDKVNQVAGPRLAATRQPDGGVVLRSAGDDTVLEFTENEWVAFVAGVRGGEFAVEPQSG